MKFLFLLLKKYRLVKNIALHVYDRIEKHGFKYGRENKIKNYGIKISTRFIIKGNNNIIEIERNSVIKNSKVRIMGNNSKIIIRKGAFVDGASFWIEDNNCLLDIGENSFIGASHLAVTEDNNSITIGNNCMLSSNINIRTGDSHSIIDKSNNRRINYAASVHIENHCWIGEGAKVLKGVTIGENSIVSSGAIVTKSFASDCLIGGIPAKVIKDNVTWDKKRIKP